MDKWLVRKPASPNTFDLARAKEESTKIQDTTKSSPAAVCDLTAESPSPTHTPTVGGACKLESASLALSTKRPIADISSSEKDGNNVKVDAEPTRTPTPAPTPAPAPAFTSVSVPSPTLAPTRSRTPVAKYYDDDDYDDEEEEEEAGGNNNDD